MKITRGKFASIAFVTSEFGGGRKDSRSITENKTTLKAPSSLNDFGETLIPLKYCRLGRFYH